MKKKKSAIPLVKGATAASLAKKRDSESSTSRRKRRRRNEVAGSKESGNNSKNTEQPLFSSTAESLAVISKFHTLNKRLEQNERDESLTQRERDRNATKIKEEQEAMGGLDRYQKASMCGAKSSKFVCADWVVPLLRKQNQTEAAIGNKKGQKRRLRILDVGAIDNQYHGKGHDDWLDAVAIDLHGGQHESVLQLDFFDYAHEYCSGTDLASTSASAANSQGPKSTQNSKSPPPSSQTQKPRPFDAIVLSLVLNFQGDPRKRGDMLALAADPRLLDAGMLFVALPAASLDNSRYCDLDRFVAVVTNPLFKFELVEQKASAKLILLAFRRGASASAGQNPNTPIAAAAAGNDNKPQKSQKQTPPNKKTKTKKPKGGCCYNTSTKTFDYGDHEMKRLQPAKPGAKRNNFAVILKSSRNRS